MVAFAAYGYLVASGAAARSFSCAGEVLARVCSRRCGARAVGVVVKVVVGFLAADVGLRRSAGVCAESLAPHGGRVKGGVVGAATASAARAADVVRVGFGRRAALGRGAVRRVQRACCAVLSSLLG